MALTFVRDPQITPRLREEFLRLWFDVTQAGGAVGFVPPVTEEEIRPAAVEQLDAVAAGRIRMLAGYEDGRLAATAFLRPNDDFKMAHWSTVVLVMVDPSLQGGGRGRRLVGETVDMARDAGLEALRLVVRGGTGTERFYEVSGFKEVGRVPAGLKLPGDDYRDEILMWLPLP
ncbi:GNAT family N-acetyltransferase [Streptomyces sp. AV19]|uniref:GNAT family N-acetyltransferase n=1 Tax=Streptomyces sp. AV19 TaxID=2793068 RepID=UPI0018FF0FF5|nr:GNAT family N-acetyltransferase [Streptomyces sp. AV19]MBH1935042.1 GNAT family N-acetyltransferase [Streptomyces sp. AV19]MDG4530975.1 GNAT family N-acetyltransferase [Streptomyces sp. AV19]